jgi:hypothetical protein
MFGTDDRPLDLSRPSPKLAVYLRRYRQRLWPLVAAPLVDASGAFVFFIDYTFNTKYITCQSICLTKCMITKMGRPRLPKSKAKGVLIGARFSPPEARIVVEAVKRAKRVKSEWVRTVLLSAAQA